MTVLGASKILRQCEQTLQTILQQAVQCSNYDLLQQVAYWARCVGDLADEAEALALESTESISGESDASIRSLIDRSRPATSRNIEVPRSASKIASKPRKNHAYPKFARRGDQLIKIGWSKKEKKEYQHKSPKHIAELLRDALFSSSEDSEVLSTDDLFPLYEQDGSEVPSYQSYVCLAWFKSEGLVVQEGRQGYQVPSKENLADSLATRWQSLSEA